MTDVMIQQPVDAPSMPGMNQSRSLGAQISPSSQPIAIPSSKSDDTRKESIDGNKEETMQSNLSKVIAQVTPSNVDDVEVKLPNMNNNKHNSNPVIVKHSTERLHHHHKMMKKKPELQRIHSAPALKKYDDCREFDKFAGDWIDSKGQTVLISPWGVIRYPNNPKLRFEAIYMGPNHLSVTFDKDPKRRKFVGKLNHDCDLLIWSNDTKWARKGSKHDPRFQPVNGKNGKKNSSDNKGKPNHNKNGSCLIQ